MQQIFNFLVRFKTGLTFFLLFFVAIALIIEAHSYHSSKWVSSTNFISGSIYEASYNVSEYFNLKSENKKLSEENADLRNALINLQHNIDFPSDSLITQNTSFKSFPAKILANSYAKKDNYLLLNKGSKDTVAENMGVISSKGIVGVIEETSESYARIISILNSNISINAKLKKSNHFGSLVWDGKNPNLTQLIDVPRSATIQKGDTIVTGGNSLIFPANIPIGYVSNFDLNENQGYYTIQVSLFNDMTSVENVYVIQFNKQEEASLLFQNNASDE
ncbi:rod shape-determining protein MreC [Psychroflexus salis]|uniref:Cell shape-determining protein MreC n=1 Tax=Psychroflexus salis TaxID=1526574 RepID=A0A917A1I1_9FLAO|nr:rod shape-determining protein MreC [Psychroflexus salis]GGE22464.1 rod shape-determining protein MreC [Psychroflexus salis]